jgi:hypothetical protein
VTRSSPDAAARMPLLDALKAMASLAIVMPSP